MINLERFPEPRAQTLFSRAYHETVGETGAGKALNLAKLGMPTTLHAMIGADDFGHRIREFLAREGVIFLHDIDPKGTERHVNLMSDDGGRISIYMAYATFEPEVSLARLEPIIAAADHVVISIINYCHRLIPVARRLGKPIWCDIHDWDGRNDYHRDFVAAADYVFMSSDAMPDYRAFMQRQIADGKQLVVCTHGRRGSTALTAAGGWAEMPVIDSYQRVDSNGAGDAFFAGFLYGHARGYTVERCLRIATIVSGLCITSRELAFMELTRQLLAAEYRKHYGEAL
jgi:sugar/nucleoside kinase (ribokinase family)